MVFSNGIAFFVIVLGAVVLNVAGVTNVESAAHLHEKYHSLAHHGKDKIAIISVEGTIMTGEGFVKKQIDQVREDKNVKAIVIRIDSPGGTVTGSDYIYHHLRKLVEER